MKASEARSISDAYVDDCDMVDDTLALIKEAASLGFYEVHVDRLPQGSALKLRALGYRTVHQGRGKWVVEW